MSTNQTAVKAGSSGEIAEWRPEDDAFWESTGKRIANRNLWMPSPASCAASPSG